MAIVKREVTKLEKARAQLVMDHPFVASILLKHPLTARDDIPTLCVTPRGAIYYNPTFLDSLTVPQIVFGLAHEVFHRIGQHSLRLGDRNPRKWNYAGDAWINDTLIQAKIGQFIDGGVNMPGSADKTVEQIYDELPEGDDGGGGGNGDGEGENEPGGIGQDILYEEGEGSGQGRQLTESEIKEIQAEIKMEVAEAAQAAKMRGNLSAVLQKFAESIIASKTPWYEILEQFMTGKVKQSYSWARPNRKYEDVYMPSYDNLPSMGELAIQVDISGSISRREIAHYNGHLSRIIEQCRPTKVHVMYTDTAVSRYEVYAQDEPVEIKFYSGGGTDMTAGFAYLAAQGVEPDAFVTLTDGYTPFPEREDYPSVWCISSEVKAPEAAGQTVHFEMT